MLSLMADLWPVAVTVGVIALAIIGLVYRQREHERQINAWKSGGEAPLATQHDVNGLGDRVRQVEQEFAKAEGEGRTRLVALEQLVRDQSGELRRTQEDVARILRSQDHAHTELHEMKEELIGFMSERLSKVDSAVHDLDKRVAIVQRDVEQLGREQERRPR